MADQIPMLRVGSKGPYVRVVQEILNLYFAGTREALVPDGNFGGKTDAALKAYQTRFKLQVDGILGPKTHAVMFPFSTYVLNVRSVRHEGTVKAPPPLAGQSLSLGFALPGNLLGQVAGNPGTFQVPPPPPPPPPTPPATGQNQTVQFKPVQPSGKPISTPPPGTSAPMPAPAPTDKDEKTKEVQLSVGNKLDLPKKTLKADKPSKPNQPNPPKDGVVFSAQGVLKNPGGGGSTDVSLGAQAAVGTVKDKDGKLWTFTATAQVTRSQDLVQLGDFASLKAFGVVGFKASTNGVTPGVSGNVGVGAGLSIKVTKDSKVTFDIKGQTLLEGTYDKNGLNLHHNNSTTGNLVVHF